MGRANEDGEGRPLVLDLGMITAVPPKANRTEPWVDDRARSIKRALKSSGCSPN